eukprot:g57610.t1
MCQLGLFWALLALFLLAPTAHAANIKVCVVPGCNSQQYCQNMTSSPLPFEHYCLTQDNNNSLLVSCRKTTWFMYVYQVAGCPGTNYTKGYNGVSGECSQGPPVNGKSMYYQVDCASGCLLLPQRLVLLGLLAFSFLFLEH